MTQKTNQPTLWQKIQRQWKNNPLFSTALVLVLMIILQTLALGFEFESFGAWFSHWSRNWINILRNNATVGIVALGMCFVIISGGIDLAVGSTLVAVGATLMFFINGYPTGLLTAAGITGVPAFVIGIAACIAMGCALGGVSGFLIAKQKLPAFIGHIYAMVLVLFGWVLFFFEDMTALIGFFKRLFTPVAVSAQCTNLILGYLPMLVISIVAAVPMFKTFGDLHGQKPLVRTLKLFAVAVLLVLCVASLVSQSYNPFIYFKF